MAFLSAPDDVASAAATFSSAISGGVACTAAADSDSDAEHTGNPMVMAFQDEVDDEDDYVKSPVCNDEQQTESSDEEIPRPKAEPAAKDVVDAAGAGSCDEPDDFDDWLNSDSVDFGFQAKKPSPMPPVVLAVVPPVVLSPPVVPQVVLVGPDPPEEDTEVAPRSSKVKTKKSKTKKSSKRKSKRKDGDDADEAAAADSDNGGGGAQSFGDYEEI